MWTFFLCSRIQHPAASIYKEHFVSLVNFWQIAMHAVCQAGATTRNKPASILFSSELHGTLGCRFTFGKNFSRDLKSVFGPIEIWLAIGANMGEGEFLASNSKWGRDIGERAVHVQIYVDSLRNFCPCKSLKCSEEGCSTWLLPKLHFLGHYLFGSTVIWMPAIAI